jgi:hypothetical protein
MMHKIIKCGLIGGFVLFIWGAVSWSVLPWQKNQMQTFSNESEVRSALGDRGNASGLYLVPNVYGYSNDPAGLAKAQGKMKEGPFAFVSLTAEGKNPSSAGSVIASLIVKIVGASLATWLLLKTASPMGYTKVVQYITMIGILLAVMSMVPLMIWFGFPANYVIGSMIDIVFGWFFAGLAIARIVMPVHKAKA